MDGYSWTWVWQSKAAGLNRGWNLQKKEMDRRFFFFNSKSVLMEALGAGSYKNREPQKRRHEGELSIFQNAAH